MTSITVTLPARNIEYVKNHPDACIPTLATQGSVGYDLYSIEEAAIGPFETKVFDTGLVLLLSHDMYAEIKSRSSLSARGINVQGGVVDSDYRGNIKVILLNTSNIRYVIKPGMRIAQMVFRMAIRPDISNDYSESMDTESDEKNRLQARIKHLEQNDATNQKLIQDLLAKKTVSADDEIQIIERTATEAAASQEISSTRTGGFGSTGQ